MSLKANLSLSKTYIGTGTLYHNIISFVDDNNFPAGSRVIPIPGETDIALWTGQSDDSIDVISSSILNTILYGYSAFQLAVKYGFKGTEEEYANAPLKCKAETIANDAKELVDAAKKDIKLTNEKLAKWSSFNFISPMEKAALKQQQKDIQAEYTEVINNAKRYSVAATSYTSAYNTANAALLKYTEVETEDITVEEDYGDISLYYSARQDILELIGDATKEYYEKLINGIQVSNVNLVAGTKELIFPAGLGNYNNKQISLEEPIKSGDQFTLYINNIERVSGTTTKFTGIISDETVNNVFIRNSELGIGENIWTFKIPDNVSKQTAKLILYAGVNGATSGNAVNYYGVTLVRGNKPMLSWSPSVGETQSKFNDIDYLKQAFPKSTVLNAGVVLSDFMGVHNSATTPAVVAGISGVNFLNANKPFVDGDYSCPMAFWGATDVANANNANTRIYSDGTIVTKSLRGDNGCQLGDFTIGSEGSEKSISYEKITDIGFPGDKGLTRQAFYFGGMECGKFSNTAPFYGSSQIIGIGGIRLTLNGQYCSAMFIAAHPNWAGILIDTGNNVGIEMASGYFSGFRLKVRHLFPSISATYTLTEYDNIISIRNVINGTHTVFVLPTTPKEGHIYRIVARSAIPSTSSVRIESASSPSLIVLGSSSMTSLLTYSGKAICLNLVYDGHAWVVTNETYTA